jgi:hypothetical protein
MKISLLTFWPFLFLLIFIEGVIASVSLGVIPPDAKNAILLGFSVKRLAMLAFILGVSLAAGVSAWFSWRKPAWREKGLNPLRKTKLFLWLMIGSLALGFCLELGLLYLKYYDPVRLSPLYLRSKPLLGYLLVVCVEMAAWLLLLRLADEPRLFWRQALLWVVGWAGLSILAFWSLSPQGRAVVDTWWYIQTFDPVRYELHGSDYCSADYSGGVERQYQRASDLRLKLAHINRPKALLAIFDKITKGATTNSEKHLKLLNFIQRASYHTEVISSYSAGDWVYDPLVLLELGDMWCTQGAILAIDLFGSAGYPGRLVQLANHQIAEIYYDGDWHYFDTDSFGNGETILDASGNIPSVAEMSKTDYQKLDTLPAFQESLVMDCTASSPEQKYYPSYSYFSSQAYERDVPQNYYVGLYSAYNFEHGWKPVDEIPPQDTVRLNDLPPFFTPAKPDITSVQVDQAKGLLDISFRANDPQNDLAGIQVFISDHSRGWDYNQFYGDKPAKAFWADRQGWQPEMYQNLFELPPSNLGSITLGPNAQHVQISVKPGLTYFITVMPFDSYGRSVGRTLYPVSNELKVTIP